MVLNSIDVFIPVKLWNEVKLVKLVRLVKLARSPPIFKRIFHVSYLRVFEKITISF